MRCVSISDRRAVHDRRAVDRAVCVARRKGEAVPAGLAAPSWFCDDGTVLPVNVDVADPSLTEDAGQALSLIGWGLIAAAAAVVLHCLLAGCNHYGPAIMTAMGGVLLAHAGYAVRDMAQANLALSAVPERI